MIVRCVQTADTRLAFLTTHVDSTKNLFAFQKPIMERFMVGAFYFFTQTLDPICLMFANVIGRRN